MFCNMCCDADRRRSPSQRLSLDVLEPLSRALAKALVLEVAAVDEKTYRRGVSHGVVSGLTEADESIVREWRYLPPCLESAPPERGRLNHGRVVGQKPEDRLRRLQIETRSSSSKLCDLIGVHLLDRDACWWGSPSYKWADRIAKKLGLALTRSLVLELNVIDEEAYRRGYWHGVASGLTEDHDSLVREWRDLPRGAGAGQPDE